MDKKSLLTWWEEWDEAAGEIPRELNSCGWKCPFCNEDLGTYLTEATGEAHYLDNFDNPPQLNYCPNCGKQLTIDVPTTTAPAIYYCCDEIKSCKTIPELNEKHEWVLGLHDTEDTDSGR